MTKPVPSLLTSGSAGAGATANTASISPAANRLITVHVALRCDPSTVVDNISLSGNGLTWVRMQETVLGGNRLGGTFRSMGASPSSGVITISYSGGGTPAAYTWVVVEWPDVITTGANGADAVGTTDENSGVGTPGTGTITGTPGSEDVTAAVLHTMDDTLSVVVPSGYAGVGNITGTDTQTWLAYDSDATTSFSYTWSGAGSTTRDWATHGFIVKGAAGGGTTQNLAGDAAAAATAAAQLAIDKAMASAATAGVTAAGQLALLKSLLVAASAQAAAVGDLGLAKLLAGAATAGAVATGDLSTGAIGTITTPPLKNNTGTELAGETGATVHVYTTAGAHVVTKTGETTDGSGVLVITDAAIVASTAYRLVIVLASGAEGMEVLTAT